MTPTTMTTTTTTTTMNVNRYSDGAILGRTTLGAADWDRYEMGDHPSYQWSQGIARAADVLTEVELEEMGIDGDTVIWLGGDEQKTTPPPTEMEAMLEAYGPAFTGGTTTLPYTAADWIDHGFDADSAGGWCEIGVWDAGTAAEFRDAGLTPTRVADAAERLIEGLAYPGSAYTSGSPIYAACNRDISARVIIHAAD